MRFVSWISLGVFGRQILYNIILKFLGSLRVEGCFFRWLDILLILFLETSDLVWFYLNFLAFLGREACEVFLGKWWRLKKWLKMIGCVLLFKVSWYSLKRTATKNRKKHRPLSTKMGKKSASSLIRLIRPLFHVRFSVSFRESWGSYLHGLLESRGCFLPYKGWRCWTSRRSHLHFLDGWEGEKAATLPSSCSK